MDTKKCARCKKPKPLDDFPLSKQNKDGRYSYCKKCKVEQGRERDKQRATSRWHARRDSILKSKYGITSKEYDAMLKKQNGKCAICKTDKPTDSGTSFFSVDHCHQTKIIRGLLCRRCNMGLGYFADDPVRLSTAIDYLTTERT